MMTRQWKQTAELKSESETVFIKSENNSETLPLLLEEEESLNVFMQQTVDEQYETEDEYKPDCEMEFTNPKKTGKAKANQASKRDHSELNFDLKPKSISRYNYADQMYKRTCKSLPQPQQAQPTVPVAEYVKSRELNSFLKSALDYLQKDLVGIRGRRKTENARHGKKVESLEQQLKTSDGETKSLTKLADNLKWQASSHTENSHLLHTATINTILNAQSKEIQDLNARCKTLAAANDFAEGKIRQLDRQLASSEKHAVSLKLKVEQSKFELDACLEDSRRNTKSMKARLETALSEREEATKKVKEVQNAAHDETDRMKLECERLEAEKQVLIEQMMKIQEQLKIKEAGMKSSLLAALSELQ